MNRIMILLVLLLSLFAMTTSPSLSSSDPPEIWSMTPLASMLFPASSPGLISSPRLPKHHQKRSPAGSPFSFNLPQCKDCGEISCTDPFIQAPKGFPCGCILPIRVVIDVGIDLYVLFHRVKELEAEVASSIFLKRRQVKVNSVVTSSRGQGRTELSLLLVPLEEKFDNMTASLIYERFWEKKVRINKSHLYQYDVIYVHYPGLPSSPPSSFQQSSISPPSGPGSAGNSPYPFTADRDNTNNKKLNARSISITALSSCILIFVCVGIAIFVLKSLKIWRPSAVSDQDTLLFPRSSAIRSIIANSAANSTPASFLSTMANCSFSLRTFTLSELEKATDSFSLDRKLGEGGSSCVYLGVMEDGSEVAVKLIKRTAGCEFVSELEMLSRLHHRNLVKLIGVCMEEHTRCLVYELVPNGSVQSHLHGADKGKGPLTWDARMKIALGSARALAYLHDDSDPSVIHRDFKASNILLEEDFTPKVSDFGLAKEASDGIDYVSTRIMGTFGYVAPEYAMTGHLLVKSDVYSYGVVLLELLSGRKPVHVTNVDPENLVVWARPLLGSKEGINQLLDPYLRENCDNFDNIELVAAVALMCVHEDPSQRPFMGEVTQALKLLVCRSQQPVCEGSPTPNESTFSSFGLDNDFFGDSDLESCWWSDPRVHDSWLLVNMEYSVESVDEMRRPHSISGLVGRPEPGGSFSGPLRSKMKKQKQQEFYKMRGAVSEHGSPSLHTPPYN